MPQTNEAGRRPLPSPAALLLAIEGSAIRDLAEAAGISQSYASQILSGRRRMPERVQVALVRLVGEVGAASVVDAIPTDSAALAA